MKGAQFFSGDWLINPQHERRKIDKLVGEDRERGTPTWLLLLGPLTSVDQTYIDEGTFPTYRELGYSSRKNCFGHAVCVA